MQALLLSTRTWGRELSFVAWIIMKIQVTFFLIMKIQVTFFLIMKIQVTFFLIVPLILNTRPSLSMPLVGLWIFWTQPMIFLLTSLMDIYSMKKKTLCLVFHRVLTSFLSSERNGRHFGYSSSSFKSFIYGLILSHALH